MPPVTNLPDKRLDAAGTAIGLVKGDFSDYLAAVIPVEMQSVNASDGVADDSLLSQLLDLFNLARELRSKGLFQRLEMVALGF